MKTTTPLFTFEVNYDHEVWIINEFLKAEEPVIFHTFPELRGLKGKDLKEKLEEIVSSELKKSDFKIDEKLITKKLNEVTKTLSEVLDEDWSELEKFKIYRTICPIKPRYLAEKIFTVGFKSSPKEIIIISAHELIHFLYFKKWAKIFPKDSFETYDYPHENWVLSEILAPVIMNDKKVQEITNWKEELYPNWQGTKIEGKNLLDIFQEIYEKSENFESFLIESRKRFEELDKKFSLVKNLTGGTITK